MAAANVHMTPNTPTAILPIASIAEGPRPRILGGFIDTKNNEKICCIQIILFQHTYRCTCSSRVEIRKYADITKLRKNKRQIVLKNKTKGWTFKKITRYTGPAATAEWIMEAPFVNGQIARLANYRKVLFQKCRVNDKNALLKPNNGGIMIQRKRAVSTPSLPNKTRNGFVVAYGSKMPSPSKSSSRSS